MRVLDLFSGIGGFSLGLHRAGMETIAFCEFDEFAKKVLKKNFPDIPIYPDVRTLDATNLEVDLVCGGFPCQPFSVAGKQKGKSDDRHLWPEMFRIIKECKPAWVIGENVSGFLNMAFDDCKADLESEGYKVGLFLLPACGVEAHHKRERCWIVAHSSEFGRRGRGSDLIERYLQGYCGASEENQSERDGRKFGVSETGCSDRPEHRETMAYTCESGLQGLSRGSRARTQGESPRYSPKCDKNVAYTFSERGRGGNAERENTSNVGESPGDSRDNTGGMESGGIEPGLDRTPHGLPRWMDGFEYCGNPDRFGTPRVTTVTKDRANRLKCLGNAVVPQIPEIIGRAIMEVERQMKANSNIT